MDESDDIEVVEGDDVETVPEGDESGDVMDGDIDVDELVEHELENEEEELEEIEEALEETEEIKAEMDEVREEEENTAGFKRVQGRNTKNGKELILNGGRANGVEPRTASSEYLNVVYLGIGILVVVLMGMCLAYTKKEKSMERDSDFVPVSTYGTAL